MSVARLRIVDRDPADGPFEALPSDLPAADMVARMYEQFSAKVFHLALRYGHGNRAWAEDVTQDVFVRLFRHVDEVNHMDNVAGWFYRVTTNLCLNRLRRDAFLGLPPVRWLLRTRKLQPATPEQLGIDRADLAHAFDLINRQPPKARACFYMHRVDGIPQIEIANMLGHSKGYVSKLIARVDDALEGLEDGDD